MKSVLCYFSLAVLVLCFISPAYSQIPEEERQALIDLYT